MIFPSISQKLVAALVWLLAISGASNLSAQSLDPNKPPGGNFNLTNFYLGLPVDSSGGTNGNSASVPAAQLMAGYSNALYFYTGADGAMVFWAPVTGATTSGSSYPRSELREQINPPSNTSNWVPMGTHVLNAQCRVTQIPSSGKVIIGQIHCQTGNARPLVKLQFNNGVIEALIKTNSNFDPDFKQIFQNVGLGNLVTYQIKMEKGQITTTVNGSSQTINVFATDPDWATNGLYFKAGSYCQDNSGTTNEGARVSFYSLSRSHAPSITGSPTSRSAAAGSNTTFNVSASGNGVLRYQWRFNDTNILNGATNESLTLINVQAANAGGYSVAVSDNLGTATSSVAGLVVTDLNNSLAQYQSTLTGQSPLYYFKLDGSLTNSGSAGPLALAVTGGWFTNGYSTGALTARSFTASTDSLTDATDFFGGGQTAAGGNANAIGTGSITLLMRTLDTTANSGQRFVFSQGNTTSDRNAFGLFFENQSNSDPGALKLRAGNTTFTLLSSNQIQTGTWYYLAVTYDETRDSSEIFWWLGPVGGQLTNGVANPANDSVIGNNGTVYFGNQVSGSAGFRDGSSHGRVDELAVWHRELSGAEISEQFAALTAEKPALPPTLSIKLAGIQIVLTWPVLDAAGFELEQTGNLTTPDWQSAGVPSSDGERNHLTNDAPSVARFYRLRKP